jgi:hypothetical protein
MFGGGQGQSQDRRDKYGNPQTIVRLYDTGKAGLRGVVTIGGRRFKLFITRANTPKKENHTHWCAVTLEGRRQGEGFRGSI